MCTGCMCARMCVACVCVNCMCVHCVYVHRHGGKWLVLTYICSHTPTLLHTKLSTSTSTGLSSLSLSLWFRHVSSPLSRIAFFTHLPLVMSYVLSWLYILLLSLIIPTVYLSLSLFYSCIVVSFLLFASSSSFLFFHSFFTHSPQTLIPLPSSLFIHSILFPLSSHSHFSTLFLHSFLKPRDLVSPSFPLSILSPLLFISTLPLFLLRAAALLLYRPTFFSTSPNFHIPDFIKISYITSPFLMFSRPRLFLSYLFLSHPLYLFLFTRCPRCLLIYLTLASCTFLCFILVSLSLGSSVSSSSSCSL